MQKSIDRNIGNSIGNKGGGVLRGEEIFEDKNTFTPLLLNSLLLREWHGIFRGW